MCFIIIVMLPIQSPRQPFHAAARERGVRSDLGRLEPDSRPFCSRGEQPASWSGWHLDGGLVHSDVEKVDEFKWRHLEWKLETPGRQKARGNLD